MFANKSGIYLLALSTAALILASAPAYSKKRPFPEKFSKDAMLTRIKAEAVRRIYKGNMAAARAAAIEIALAKAVGRAASDLMGLDSPPRRTAFYTGIIKRKKNNFLLGYKIIEEKEENGSYKVRISATIKTKTLRRELDKMGALEKSSSLPALAVFTCLKGMEKEGEKTAENNLKRTLESVGLVLSLYKRLDICPPSPVASLPAELKEKADTVPHDIAVILRISEHGDKHPFFTMGSDLIYTKDGTSVHRSESGCTPPPSLKGTDRETALSEGMLECALDLSEEILSLWNKKVSMFSIIKIEFKGFKDKPSYDSVVKAIKAGMPKLEKLELKSFSASSITMNAVYRGETARFNRKLGQIIKDMNKPIEISSTEEGTVTIIWK